MKTLKKVLLSKYFVIPVIGFLLGFLWVAFVHLGYFHQILESLQTLPWYAHILLGVLAIFIVILVHELGHLILLVIMGFKIKAIYVLMLVLVKNKKWQFKFFWRFTKMLGGVVIPIIDNITDDTSLMDAKKRLAKGVSAGPLASLIYCVILNILLITAILVNIPAMVAWMFVLTVVTIFMTVLVFAASFASMPGLYGDFILKDKLKNDDIFGIYYLSLEKTDNDAQNYYFWTKMVPILENNGFMESSETKGILLNYLQRLVFEKYIGCAAINKRLDQLNFIQGNKEEILVLNYHLMYYYVDTDQLSKAKIIFDKLKQAQYNVKPEVSLYWQKVTDHYFNLSDETIFLSDIKNYYPQSISWIFSPIDVDHDIPAPINNEKWYNKINNNEE